MKIYNVADLPDEFGSCVECRKYSDGDKSMKKIVFEYKNGKYTSTQPIYLCSECYEELFQLICNQDNNEGEKLMNKLEKRKEETKEYRQVVDKCLYLMDKYSGTTFGIPVWIDRMNRKLQFKNDKTGEWRLLTKEEVLYIIDKYEKLDNFVAELEKETNIGY